MLAFCSQTFSAVTILPFDWAKIGVGQIISVTIAITAKTGIMIVPLCKDVTIVIDFAAVLVLFMEQAVPALEHSSVLIKERSCEVAKFLYKRILCTKIIIQLSTKPPLDHK